MKNDRIIPLLAILFYAQWLQIYRPNLAKVLFGIMRLKPMYWVGLLVKVNGKIMQFGRTEDLPSLTLA